MSLLRFNLIVVAMIFTGLFFAGTAYALEYGSSLESEDFSGTLPATWTLTNCSIENEVLPIGDNNVIEYVTISSSIGEVGAVEFDIKIVDTLSGPDSIFTISYRGQKIRIQPKIDRVSWINNDIYSLDTLAGCTYDEKQFNTNQWYTCKIVYVSGVPLVFIDGNFVHIGKNRISNTTSNLMFRSYYCSVEIDNVKIYGSVSSNWKTYNHVINSSFEYATNADVPDGAIERSHPSIGSPWRTAITYSDWHDNWYYDNTTAWDGSRSMRLDEMFMLQGCTDGYLAAGCVLSVYLKAESSASVKIGLTRKGLYGDSTIIASTTAMVGTSWQRYTLVVPDGLDLKDDFCPMIEPESNVRVWVDAIQIESGSSATSYCASPVDEHFELPDRIYSADELVEPDYTTANFKAMTRLSYYTTETSAMFYIESDIDSAGILKVNFQNNEYKFAWPHASSKAVEIPLGALNANTYNVSFTLEDNTGTQLATTTCNLVKMASNHTEVKTDRINRMIVVDGEAFFPFGLLYTGAPSEDEVAFYSSKGFNTMIMASPHWYAPGYLSDFLDDAETYGIRVIFEQPLALEASKTGKTTTMIAANKSSSAILAYVVADEPTVGDMLYVDAFLSEAKQEDPYRLAMVNHNINSFQRFQGRTEGLPGDVLCFDRYPYIGIGNSIHLDTYAPMAFLRKNMAEESLESRRHMAIFLSANEWYGIREPTERELEFLTYMSIVEGARSIYFYCNLTKSVNILDKLASLSQEIQTLAPALAETNDLPVITCNNPNIRFILTKEGTNYVLIAVNRSMESESVTFDLSSLNTSESVSVNFETRSLSINNGSLADTFAPFQRHVYSIPVWYQDWNYRQKITIDHDQVDNNLKDFPVLITVDTIQSSLFQNAQTDGDDILFTDANGVKLAHEIEQYDATQGSEALIAWVKVSSLSAYTDTEIYMYYGQATVASQEAVSNAWGNNYAGVWHLPETTGTHADSSANGNAITANGGVTQNAIGKIGGGVSIDGTNGSYLNTGVREDDLDIDTDSFTVSTWYKSAQSLSSVQQNLISDDYNAGAINYGGFSLYLTSSFVAARIADQNKNRISLTATRPQNDNWHYVVFQWDNLASEARLYVDGELKSTITCTGHNTNLVYYLIGSTYRGGPYALDGFLDEMRISNIARSNAWVKTTYNNQSSPSTFASTTAPETR